MPEYFPHGHASFMTPRNTELEAKRAKARAAGTLAVRVDGCCYEIVSDAEREAYARTGQERALALRCTSLCSGDRFLVRLNTAEEEAQDKAGRSISPRRREVRELFESIFPDSRSAPDPNCLPHDKRPVFRLDRAQALLNPDGTAREVTDKQNRHYTLMRCAWMSPVLPYTDKAGLVIDPRDHMECSHFSTVNVSLSSSTKNGASNYYLLSTKALEQAAESGENSFYKACARAAAAVTRTFDEDLRANPEAKLGSFTVTSWYPEEHICAPLDAGLQEAGDALYQYFSDPLFAPEVRDGKNAAQACAPECILRFLNDQGELCGSWRVRPWHICSREQQAYDPQERSLQRTDLFLRNFIEGIDASYRAYNKITAVDILPGRCFRVSQALFRPRNDGLSASASQQLRTLLYMALSQGRSLTGEPRLNLGSCQAFVTRTSQEYVTQVSMLRDGCIERNTASLMPEGRRLEPSAAFKEELKEEAFCLKNLEYYMQQRKNAENSTENNAGSTPGNMMKACPETLPAMAADEGHGSEACSSPSSCPYPSASLLGSPYAGM